ncbi:MAG: bifunctional ADP-dependent NAD(P)H-hydrate dehydratase/NAD(P)H-hydrate epimerase [Acidobacteria bacterium]|nr:MAG: bifunctional ADP-dependent NAD(P)H-hydrate dehydratase/NAD(P)H-hydrate epimerase [Acidobacteriota bacterium]
MKALTAAEMREVDRLTTERYGIPSLKLMENAGIRVFEIIRSHLASFHLDRPRRIAVLCGKGNNGGDGLVAARHLKNQLPNVHVGVYLFGRTTDLQRDPSENYKRWANDGGSVTEIIDDSVWTRVWEEVSSADIVVDAMLGTGLRGGASGLMARAIEELNRFSRNATAPLPSLILAVDTPSGLPSDGETAQGPVLCVHKTVTFIAPKIGQLISPEASCCGELIVKFIGDSSPALPNEVGKGSVRWAGPDEFESLPLVRAADSHKGMFGHALLVAGSVGKSGAAVLAGEGCLHGGAGLTTIATPDKVLAMVASSCAEYMTEPLFSTESGTISAANVSSGRFASLIEGKTVLALGPGLGTETETQQFVLDVVRNSRIPIILDADGLNAFAGKGDLLRERKSPFLAITPHPGEMARLLGVKTSEVQSDRLKCAAEAARRWNAHVILKGFHTVVCSNHGQAWVNTTGGAGLSKGGSGDVLTGVLAALTAQFGTQDWLRVLALGAYLHGAAGQASLGYQDPSGVVASSVAHSIPMARSTLLREVQRRG